MSISYPITDKLFLVDQKLPKSAKGVAKPGNQNLVAVIDCSGSMWGELDKIKNQLKNKISTLLRPGDTFSAIWFSGRGQYGALLEFVSVKELGDIQRIHEALDKWLRPQGLTGFKEPLALVETMATKFDNGNPWNMLFMSDGMDNQWPRTDVLKVLEETGKKVASVTVVEYGYCADRAFLAQMAAKAGGKHAFAIDFDAWAPIIEAAFAQAPTGAKKVDVKLEGDHVGGIAWTVGDKEVIAYAIEGNTISVPEGTESVFYLSSAPAKSKRGVTETAEEKWLNPAAITDKPEVDALYAGIALFAVRVQPEIVLALLKTTGDVRLIDQFANCFGKQKYSEFQQEAEAAAFDRTRRCALGYDPSRVPAEDAWTVLDTLTLLASDDHNRVLLDSKEFRYARIGRGRVVNDDALKFEPTMLAGAAGYSVDNLVFNSERPNVSIMVRKTGTVDLSKEDNVPMSIVEKGDYPLFSTQVIRNYAIIRDGLVNVDQLPALVTKEAYDKLAAVGAVAPNVQSSYTIEDVAVFQVVINLKAMPVINRKMVTELNLSSFLETQYLIEKRAAEAKVFGDYYKNLASSKQGFTQTSEGLVEEYGAGAAAWLKERGITDHGFSPRGTSAEAVDFYLGKELKVALKGLSSLPSVAKAKEALAKHAEEVKAKGDKAKPLTISNRIMKDAIEQSEAFINANKDRDAVIKGYFDGMQIQARKAKRVLQAKASQDLICVVLGQNWFGRTTLDPISVTIDTPDGKIDATVSQLEVEIKI